MNSFPKTVAKPAKPQINGALNQGPLKQTDGIAVNGLDIRKDGLNPCKWLKFMSKIFEKYFQMDNLIDRMGYRSHFLHQIVATP